MMEGITGQFAEGGTLREAGGLLSSAFTAATQGNWSEVGTSLVSAFQAVAQDPIALSMVLGTVGVAAGGATAGVVGALVGGLAGTLGPQAVQAVRRGPEAAALTR